MMLPLPLATKLVPAVPVAVQAAPPYAAGKTSLTLAATASEGPPSATLHDALPTSPGTATVLPSVFVTDRSATGVKVSVSVSLLLPEVGSLVPLATAAEAVLLSVPVAALLTVPVTV